MQNKSSTIARCKASASFAPRPFVAFKAKGLRMFALGGPKLQVEMMKQDRLHDTDDRIRIHGIGMQ